MSDRRETGGKVGAFVMWIPMRRSLAEIDSNLISLVASFTDCP